MSIFFAAKQKVSAQGQSSAAKNIFSVAKTTFFVAKAQVVILRNHFNGPLPRLDDLSSIAGRTKELKMDTQSFPIIRPSFVPVIRGPKMVGKIVGKWWENGGWENGGCPHLPTFTPHLPPHWSSCWRVKNDFLGTGPTGATSVTLHAPGVKSPVIRRGEKSSQEVIRDQSSQSGR